MMENLFKLTFLGLVVGLLSFNWLVDRDDTIVNDGQSLVMSAVAKVNDGDYHNACHDMQSATELLRDTKYFNQTADLKTKICGIADVIHELKPDITI
jgi:hypothetical protein